MSQVQGRWLYLIAATSLFIFVWPSVRVPFFASAQSADEISAKSLIEQGRALLTQGKYKGAFDIFSIARDAANRAADRSGTATALRMIGNVHYYQGDYSEALEQYQKSLEISEEISDKVGINSALNNIGNVHKAQGNYTGALGQYQKSLEISEEISDKAGIAYTLNNIGEIHRLQGDAAEALEKYQKSLKTSKEIADKAMIAITLNNIGIIKESQGDFPEALEHYWESLTISEEFGTRSDVVSAMNGIGNIHLLKGNYKKALELYQKNLEISEKIGDKSLIGATLANIGYAHEAGGNFDGALRAANRAAIIAEQIGFPELFWQARSKAADAYRALNRMDEARQAYEDAIKAIESLRTNIAGGEARVTHLARVRDPYEFYIDLLMQEHRQKPSAGLNVLALEASEKARARSLLELLKEARADIRQSVDPGLLARERSLLRMLNAKNERLVRLLSSEHTEQQAKELKAEVDRLASEFQQTKVEIRIRSPRYANLTQPQPLGARDIQRQIVDRDSLLLAYSLGTQRSYLWAVSPDSILSYELPKYSVIAAAAERVYKLLTARFRQTEGETSEQRRVRIRRANASYPAAAAVLSRMVLGPVAAQLGTKRLIIVGERLLQYTPFAALPTPGVGRSKRSNRPLVLDHEIVNLQSASTLAVLRSELKGRPLAPKTAAVLADPVFDSTDLRVERVATNGVTRKPDRDQTLPKSQMMRSLKDIEMIKGERLFIPRLGFSHREAQVIQRLVPENMRRVALGFEVNYATATDPELGNYRIIHFATHSLFNSKHPELSGILLSLVDQRGRAQERGMLNLVEVYNLNLPAELVVLSACQTGLGKDVKGEGLIGLTRGFMYAGAPRVIASLWPVDDAATAELMKLLYEGILGDGRLRPAEALRRAQITMWRRKTDWSAPYYWAAFTLQGEWK